MILPVTARRYRVTGRVQGVFYRASTRTQALQLGLTGHALNRPDGSVEVLACGAEAAIDTLLAWLWLGPPAAAVTGVELLESLLLSDPPPAFVTG